MKQASLMFDLIHGLTDQWNPGDFKPHERTKIVQARHALCVAALQSEDRSVTHWQDYRYIMRVEIDSACVNAARIATRNWSAYLEHFPELSTKALELHRQGRYQSMQREEDRLERIRRAAVLSIVSNLEQLGRFETIAFGAAYFGYDADS